MKIAIIDYGIGNIQSIYNSIRMYDIEINITDDKNEILESDGVILPGVGAFKKAMEELEKRGLVDTINQFIKLDRPFLGICLGMQLLFDSSEEFGYTKGLGIIKGKVEHFEPLNSKLPHIGWNEVNNSSQLWENTILDNISNSSLFYFVHTYICKPSDNSVILSESNYDIQTFCSSLKYKNVYATQFHPEKSAEIGLHIMSNFVKIIQKGNI